MPLLGVEQVPMGQAMAAPEASPAERSQPAQPAPPTPRHTRAGHTTTTTTTTSAPEPSPARYTSPTMPTPPADAGPPEAPLDTKEKLAVLQAMDENEVRGCTKCELCHSRTQTVFGEGDPDADIMFIGEGPGQNEDEQGRPFVGRAGELLTKMIEAMGLQREDVFIANIVKCRPPNNRTPSPDEVAACWDYLRRQMQTIRPKAIVTLGGPATKTLLDTKEGITRLRGTWHEYAGVQPAIPLMPTFHPAYLLRNYTRDTRGKVWSDLQAVLKHVGKAAK